MVITHKKGLVLDKNTGLQICITLKPILLQLSSFIF